jgi:DNA mismatch endonuclease (patch repair protein)
VSSASPTAKPRWTPEHIAARMSAQPRRDTSPELELRRLLHARGLRFRTHRRIVPGAPRREVDVAFVPARVAVNVHGCFWHGCPAHARLGAGDRRAWWAGKLAANVARDEDTRSRLEAAGWWLFEVWECDSLPDAAARVEEAVRFRRPATPARDGRAQSGR